MSMALEVMVQQLAARLEEVENRLAALESEEGGETDEDGQPMHPRLAGDTGASPGGLLDVVAPKRRGRPPRLSGYGN